MKKLHYVYMKHVMGELEHDAIMTQAQKCNVESAKKYLNLIVGFEIDRLRTDYIESLNAEELQAYQDNQKDKILKSDEEIPF